MDPAILQTVVQPELAEDAAAQLQQLQHFAQLGRLSASLLHEISNPLTAALLQLGQIDIHHHGIRQARHSLQALRSYVEAARQQVLGGGQIVSFAVRPQIRQLARVMQPLARSAGVKLHLDPAPDCRLHGDPVRFQQIAGNLIANAIDAYRNLPAADKQVTVNLQQSKYYLRLKVTDRGIGISPEKLPLLFEPFYTTKQGGHDMGLGLFIVQQSINEFGGTIQVSSSPRRGTSFTVSLPLYYTK